MHAARERAIAMTCTKSTLHRTTMILAIVTGVALFCCGAMESADVSSGGDDAGSMQGRDATKPPSVDVEGGGLDAKGKPPVLVGDGAVPCVEQGEQHIACSENLPLPKVIKSVVDLTNIADVTSGRCDGWKGEKDAFVLPDAAEDYPLLIKLSRAGFAGTCTCNPNVTPITAYGVAFDVPRSLLDGSRGTYRRIVVRVVNDDWRQVSGCASGEAAPCACLGGYQEFELSGACVVSHSGGFGVATANPDAGPAEVLVDLAPVDFPLNCCPFACDR